MMSNSAVRKGGRTCSSRPLPCAVARHLAPSFDLLDASDVEADGRVELERPASGVTRAAVYHTDLFSQLVMKIAIVWTVDGAGPLRTLGHETGCRPT